jgi:hypothetical protein
MVGILKATMCEFDRKMQESLFSHFSVHERLHHRHLYKMD